MGDCGDPSIQCLRKEEARLAALEAEQTDSRRRLEILRREFASLGVEPEIRVHLPLVIEAPAPPTPTEKVKLFRTLFRGREELCIPR